MLKSERRARSFIVPVGFVWARLQVPSSIYELMFDVSYNLILQSPFHLDFFFHVSLVVWTSVLDTKLAQLFR